MNMNEMMPTNSLEALQFCESMLNKILDLPLKTSRQEHVFPQKTIDSLQEIAGKDFNNRKKKNVGIIGGSVTGITGGAMSILGVALIPVTGGLSLGLLVSGGIVAVAGAGTSIGFNVENYFGSKQRQEEFKPIFEMYIEFHKHFGEATIEIHELLNFIRKTMQSTLPSRALLPQQTEIITKIDREVQDLYEHSEEKATVPEKLRHLSNCVHNIYAEIGELIKVMVSVRELRAFPQTLQERRQEKLERSLNGAEKDGENVFELLEKAIPEEREEPLDDDDYTFRVFARRYLGVDVDIDDFIKLKHKKVTSGEVVSKLGAGGTAIGARALAGTLQVSDDIARGSVFIAKILNGLSAASVVLSGIGIGLDVGFLAFAVRDLYKMRKNEKKRERGEDIQDPSFYDQLRDLAETMDLINKMTTGQM